MAKYAMVVDLDRCQGCRACVAACKIENNTGRGMLWMHVFRLEEGTYPDTKISFLPRPCQHCDNAPCVKVCPTGARYKREDGLVLTDYERCIGCRYCEVACPYGVNYFNWEQPDESQYADVVDWEDEAIQSVTGGAIPPYENPDLDELWGEEQRRTAGGGHAKGVMEKCTFCVHRVEQGLLPACVDTCPTYALRFGDVSDADTPISAFLRERDPWHLLDEIGTDPRIYYVGGKPPSVDMTEIERPMAEV